MNFSNGTRIFNEKDEGQKRGYMDDDQTNLTFLTLNTPDISINY